MYSFFKKLPFYHSAANLYKKRKREDDRNILNLPEQTWSKSSENWRFQNKAKKHLPFFRQPIVFYNIFERFNLFEFYCTDKKVLHVGCTDYPVFTPENNLHILLNKFTTSIHGLDVDKEGFQILQQHVDQPYYTNVSELTESYDICLIPEVIEHVDNLKGFLSDIEKVEAKTFIITGPNAFARRHIKRNYFSSGKLSIEINHADHNCWFSPYTLKNVIEKYSSLKVDKIYLMNHQTMICCICSKK